MSDMHEAVALPDPAVKRLLHPTDLPEARSLYLRGWWFGRLCSLPVVAAIAAVAWMLSGNLLATVAATSSTFVIALIASRWHHARAWDFIPRKRQDTEGAASWRLLASVIDAMALVVTALAVLVATGSRPLPEGVIAFAVGAGAGVALVQIIELMVAIAGRRHPVALAQRLVMLAAVAVSAVVVATVGLGGQWASEHSTSATMGAATILIAQSLWWIYDVVRNRRERSR
ncbi:hypothetical protein ATJ88_2275 [Isoptericola jiangsuensis]|uniref:Uncharacterized protein n=1 Tax=Isoptericola jiangsuensis TaxID=548579 RepID=A0A2A9EX21_9MICO|nr:hypothetical protein [Isoptericola jiangsuensis]PFG43574.1 hypothetical protein ATJ88_2275 [Isoptericola jiangsuensis]